MSEPKREKGFWLRLGGREEFIKLVEIKVLFLLALASLTAALVAAVTASGPLLGRIHFEYVGWTSFMGFVHAAGLCAVANLIWDAICGPAETDKSPDGSGQESCPGCREKTEEP